MKIETVEALNTWFRTEGKGAARRVVIMAMSLDDGELRWKARQGGIGLCEERFVHELRTYEWGVWFRAGYHELLI